MLGDFADGARIVVLGHDGDVFVLGRLDDTDERDELAIFDFVHRHGHGLQVLQEALVSSLDLGRFICVTRGYWTRG